LTFDVSPTSRHHVPDCMPANQCRSKARLAALGKGQLGQRYLRASNKAALQDPVSQAVAIGAVSTSRREYRSNRYLGWAHWGRAITELASPKLLPPSVGGNTHANPAESTGPLNAKIPGNLTTDGGRFPEFFAECPR